MQNGTKKNFWENVGAKLKFRAPIIFSVGTLQLPAPPTFLTHDAAALFNYKSLQKHLIKLA